MSRVKEFAVRAGLLGLVAGAGFGAANVPFSESAPPPLSAPASPSSTEIPRIPTTAPTVEKKATFTSSISPISAELQKQMIEGKTWRPGCPVEFKDLSYITVSYWDLEGKQQQGEIVMHRSVAEKTVAIFHDLYDIKFPIEKMELPSKKPYNGSDKLAMEANLTSGFSCREDEEEDGYGEHADGTAFDVNSRLNPEKFGNGSFFPKNAGAYLDRSNVRPGMIVEGDPMGNKVIKIFESRGFKWAGRGEWGNGHYDYQHFSKKGT